MVFFIKSIVIVKSNPKAVYIEEIEWRRENRDCRRCTISARIENIYDGLYEIEMAYEQNRNGIVLQGLFKLEGRM